MQFSKEQFVLKKKLIADKKLFYTVTLLCLFGMVMLYSASNYSAIRDGLSEFYYVYKQAIAFIIGFFIMIFIGKADIEKLKKYKWFFLIISYILLAMVFLPVIGVENYGAKRWINLGLFTIQPSEFAKFFLVIFISSVLAKKNSDTWSAIFIILISGGLMCLLIMLEPNMSITLCVMAVMFIMLIVGGISIKKLLILLLPVLIGIPLLILAEPYRIKRLLAFIDPWASPLGEGYQLIQSYYAIGVGGFFGLGLFNSRQKYLFLPFSESDFIFSVICEELGLLGAIIFMAAFATIIYCGIKIAINAVSKFSCYLATGITSVIAVQTLINLCVVTGMIPPTGVPLPFISSGGSSLICFMAAVGVLQAISAQSHKQNFYHSM